MSVRAPFSGKLYPRNASLPRLHAPPLLCVRLVYGRLSCLSFKVRTFTRRPRAPYFMAFGTALPMPLIALLVALPLATAPQLANVHVQQAAQA